MQWLGADLDVAIHLIEFISFLTTSGARGGNGERCLAIGEQPFGERHRRVDVLGDLQPDVFLLQLRLVEDLLRLRQRAGQDDVTFEP